MNTFVHICKLSLGHSLFIFAKGFPSQQRFRLLSQKDTSVLLLQSRTNGIQCYSCSPLFHRLRESITIQKKKICFSKTCRISAHFLSSPKLFFSFLFLSQIKREISPFPLLNFPSIFLSQIFPSSAHTFFQFL